MSFKLIKEAQARIQLGNKITVAEQVQKVLGNASLYEVSKLLSEDFDQSEFEVTPEDYQNWLMTLIDIAQEQGVDLNRKRDFMDLLHNEILDNDPKLDALGNRMQTAERIGDALWQTYKVNKSHQALQKHVGSTIDQAREEEEAISSMMGNNSMSAEEEEGGGFSQAMGSAMGMEDEEQANPHRPGTLRHALWNDVNKKKSRAMEDEEFETDYADEPSIDDIAASITGGDGQGEVEDDQNEFGRVDDVEDHPEDVDARINDLEARLNKVEDEVEGKEAEGGDDIDYDGLGTDRGGAAQVIGVSVPASGKVDPRMDGEEPEFEDEETQMKNMFRKAVTAPREQMTQVVKDIEGEGLEAWKKLQMPKNPHPKKSQAHRAWNKGLTNAAKEALGIKDRPAPTPSKARKK